MFRVFDVTTSDVLDYESVDDFNRSAKFSFDDCVHREIDEMCRAYKHGKPTEGYEAYLGIRIVEDDTLDVYDLISLFC